MVLSTNPDLLPHEHSQFYKTNNAVDIEPAAGSRSPTAIQPAGVDLATVTISKPLLH